FIAGLLEPDPPGRIHRSVLQVLLAHADAVERHNRATLAPPELHDRLRVAITETRVDVDRRLLVSALDSVLAGEEFNDRIFDAAQHVTDRAGRLDTRAVTDRHPVTALAPSTLVHQIAGREVQADRLRG